MVILKTGELILNGQVVRWFAVKYVDLYLLSVKERANIGLVCSGRIGD